MTQFPKLQYPLDRRMLNECEGMALLNYDIIWRMAQALFAPGSPLTEVEVMTLMKDAEANLHSLGTIIERKIGPDRFETKSIDDGTSYQLK